MTTIAMNMDKALVLGLALVFVPLSLVWAYALWDSVRQALGSERRDPGSDPLSWPALLLLTGFFGGIAYLCLVLLPRLHKPRVRLRLQAMSAA